MIVILDNIRSAQNVGSIFRTCDAFGIKDIYLCGITPNQNNPKVKKTSLGAERNLNFKEYNHISDALSELKKESIKIVCLEITKNAVEIDDFITRGEIALIVGNEVNGINDDVLKECNDTVYIEMKGIKESLNVAVAFGIAAHKLSKIS